MKLSIQGSRTLDDERVRTIILKEIKKHNSTVINTSGEPKGVCEIARKICKEKAIPLKLYFLNRKKYARGCFHNRIKDIFNDSDYIIFIHKEENKGTKNEIKLTKKMNIKYTYHKIKKDEIIEFSDYDIISEKDMIKLENLL